MNDLFNSKPYDYGHIPLYGDTHTPAPTSDDTSDSATSGKLKPLHIGLIIFGVIFIVILSVLVIWFCVSRETFMKYLCCNMCSNENDKMQSDIGAIQV
jgi:hypothetical protein